MISRYALLASRIRQDVAELDLVVERVERTMLARHRESADRDLLLDAAALNLHDFYAGLERTFTQIATNVDQSVPTGPEWHRDLLRQMALESPALRPSVLSSEVRGELDEFLRFRHVVRNVYAFHLESDRVERLASRLRPVFDNVRTELIAFATVLDDVARDG